MYGDNKIMVLETKFLVLEMMILVLEMIFQVPTLTSSNTQTFFLCIQNTNETSTHSGVLNRVRGHNGFYEELWDV